jgi:hypothetical protein
MQSYIKSLLALSLLAALLLSSAVTAGPLEQAKRLHDRLAGVPADAEMLQQMTDYIALGNAQAAAELAMQHPDFYRTTLKLFATPATNRDLDIFEPLNDYSATIIGLVRDNADFRQILQTDVLYVAADSLGLPPYAADNNAHYQALEQQGIDLQQYLEPRSQSSLLGIPADASAGVMTSRAGAKAFFYLGTNRAMLRFTLMSQLCTDLEPLKDLTTPADRIRQDVSRSPGGDSRIFHNRCLGCHACLDPLAQAFAFYEYQFSDESGNNGRLFYQQTGSSNSQTGSRVQPKYHINAGNFPFGYKTEDDYWQNYWRQGQNQSLGWDNSLPGEGYGAKSLGQELAHSVAFAQCQVKKAFETTCLRPPETLADVNLIQQTSQRFSQTGYNLKQVFADTATYCMGD